MSEFMTATPGIGDGLPRAGQELTPAPKPPVTGGAPVPSQESSAFLSKLVQKTGNEFGEISSNTTANNVLSEATGTPVEDFPPAASETGILDAATPGAPTSETAPEPGSEPLVDVEPTPVDFKAQITESADDLKALWGNLTPDQIQADPELREIANSFGGDIDRFIASGQEWHTNQGSPENYKDKDIADRLGRIKESAADVLGKDKAEELIQEARTKKAAETNGNPENLSPEELRISALEAKLEQVLNSNREFAILAGSLRGDVAKLTQLVEHMNKYIQSEDVKEKKSLKKLIAELMSAFFLGAGQDLVSDVGSTVQQGAAPQGR